MFLQAEDGIRGLVRSRGLGDVYRRQRSGPSGPARTEDGNVVIEGTYQRIDDDDDAPKPKS